ncbi:hypothetical protein [Actinomyces oris]|uniref:hypothetical protein n=1 Tax=Actinomyces oris TaxID=544580 RepID=UPI000A5C882C|nr:hypothetical protein [Actinomyces oris]
MYPQFDLTEAQAGVVCLILGAVTMVNWWFAMFSDRWYGDLGRSFGEGEFNVGRNTISLILPAVGVAFSIGGCGMLLYPSGSSEGMPKVLMGTALFFVVVALLGLIPFPLPGPMYPEWQMEKRRARAEAAAREAGLDDEPTRSTGRHAAEPRKPRPRGPGRHAK